MSRIEERLAQAGHILPAPAPPAANYVPFIVNGAEVFVSGQLPLRDGKLVSTGFVGTGGVSADAGAAAAAACALNILAQLKVATGGDLDRVEQIIKLGGFVASAPDFTGQPAVVNGASDIMMLAFGEAGRHARFAVGANVLPLGASVEIDAIARLKA